MGGRERFSLFRHVKSRPSYVHKRCANTADRQIIIRTNGVLTFNTTSERRVGGRAGGRNLALGKARADLNKLLR